MMKRQLTSILTAGALFVVAPLGADIISIEFDFFEGAKLVGVDDTSGAGSLMIG